MRIGFVIYEEMTALDFVGVYDGFTRLRTMGFTDDLEWKICSLQDTVRATGGVTISATDVGGAARSV